MVHAEHHQSLEAEDKLRLLMCFLATHPDKMSDEAKLDQWVKLGGLTPQDSEAILNMAYLGVGSSSKPGDDGL
jgi:syntaxin-binding protein 1